MSEQKDRNIKSFTITKDKIDLFKEKLKSRGFLLSETQSNKFLQWRAIKDGIYIDTYNTGRIVVQGKKSKSILINDDFWFLIAETGII